MIFFTLKDLQNISKTFLQLKDFFIFTFLPSRTDQDYKGLVGFPTLALGIGSDIHSLPKFIVTVASDRQIDELLGIKWPKPLYKINVLQILLF